MRDPAEIAALAALALLCLAVRWGGFLAASADRIPPRLHRFIAAVPAPLLAALVASSAVAEGMRAIVSVLAAVAFMMILRNEIVAAFAAVAIALLFA